MGRRPKLEGEELLNRILTLVENLCGYTVNLKKEKVYDNKRLMAHLNVTERYLRGMRENGYIGYSRIGDKFWYTQKDVDRFLERFHFNEFGTTDYIGF